MKLISNTSVQAFSVALMTPQGAVFQRLGPRESVVIPDSYISDQIKNLQNRRILKVSNYN